MLGGIPSRFGERFSPAHNFPVEEVLDARYAIDLNWYSYARNNPLAMIDPSGLSPECDGNSAADVGGGSDEFCGPDISNGLQRELKLVAGWADGIRAWVKDIVRKQSRNIAEELLRRKKLDYEILAHVGARLLYFDPKGGKGTTFVSKSCPSEKCKDTVTLAGRCIHVSEVGNMVFGVAAYRFQMNPVEVTGGEIVGGRGLISAADAGGVIAGYYYAAKHGDLTIDEWLKKKHKFALDWMASATRKECAPCPESVKSKGNHIQLPGPTNDYSVNIPPKVTD
jgi:hypothetical protein